MDKNEHRIAIGITFLLMIPVCILGSLSVPGKPYNWWYTISDTYWYCSAFTFFMGACSILLILYRSYSPVDDVINCLAGVIMAGHIIFPCKSPYGLEQIGLFRLPPDTSELIHNILSGILIFLEFYTIAFRFTRGKNRKANTFYIICACLMPILGIGFFLCKIGLLPEIAKFPFEVTTACCISLCWMVKGHFF